MHMAKLADPSKDDYNMKALMAEMGKQIQETKRKAMKVLVSELEYRSTKMED